MLQSTHFSRHAHKHITAETAAEGESFFEITQQVIYYRGELWLLEQREPQKKKQKKNQSSRICLSALVRVFMCYTLTLVDQVESSRAGLAIGGKADQDLVGGG